MKDVAIEAGVSQSTVSFVINGREDMRIGEEARQRVLAAAEKLGYRPRAAGRPPIATAHGVIGIMFDEVATSPFAMITIDGAQEEAWGSDVLLEVAMSGGDKAYEAAMLRKWSADRVLGVIYGSILTRPSSPPDQLAVHRAVLLNCYDEAGRYCSVVPAERRGGEVAAKALIEAGHRRIAFISGEAWMDASVQRKEGFIRAMREAGREPDLIVEGNFLPSGGRSATLELMKLDTPPDAIFCANDLTAVGCYEALKELGLRVGKDVAVMGYDDQEIAQHLTPALSTVLLPHREMGQWAVQSILSANDLPATQTRMACPLVLRSSHRAF
jgi:LacI family transcriptional regulator